MKKVRFRNAHPKVRGPVLALRAIGASAALLATAAGCAPPTGNQDFMSGSHGILPFSIVANSPTTEKITTRRWLDQMTGGTRLIAEGQRYAPIAEIASANILTMSPNSHFNTTVSFGAGQAPFEVTLRHGNAVLNTESFCIVGAAGFGSTYQNSAATGTVTTAITAQGSGGGLSVSVSATGSITVNNCTTYTRIVGQETYTTSVENWQVSFKGTAV